MKRVTAFLFTALLAFGAGCMDYDETIELNKDGSGTIEIRMAMDREAYQDMMEMAEKYGEESDDLLSDLSEEKLRAEIRKSGSGANLLHYKEYDQGGDRVWEMKFSFEKPEDLTVLGEDEAGAMFSFAQGADGRWVFRRLLDGGAGDGAMKEEDIGMPEGMEGFDLESFDPERMEEMMKQLGEAMAELEGMMGEEEMEKMSRSMDAVGDLGERMEKMEKDSANRRFRFTVRFPGDVIESNATRTDGKTAVWEYGFADMDKMGGDLTAVVKR